MAGAGSLALHPLRLNKKPLSLESRKMRCMSIQLSSESRLVSKNATMNKAMSFASVSGPTEIEDKPFIHVVAEPRHVAMQKHGR